MMVFMVLSMVVALAALQHAVAMSTAQKVKVIVSGAGGRTGALLFKNLQNSEDFSPVGIIRRAKTGNPLRKLYKDAAKLVVADVTDVNALSKEIAASGAEKYILATSAVPKIKIWSLIKALILKLFGRASRPEFYFAKGQRPYDVDWQGAKNQIDAAKKAGIKHFVWVGSMGGTQPENFLNTIGRTAGDEFSGNILMWKRKAEQYLIQSGMKWTIVHPGGLIDKPAGEREIVLGINDELLKETVRSIPRGDVAEVCVQALREPGALNRAIDVIAKESGNPTKDFKAFWAQGGNCRY